MDQRVPVALALDASLALGEVAGTPGAVQIVEGYQQILDVGPRPHLRRTAQQHPHLPGADFGEQLVVVTTNSVTHAV